MSRCRMPCLQEWRMPVRGFREGAVQGSDARGWMGGIESYWLQGGISEGTTASVFTTVGRSHCFGLDSVCHIGRDGSLQLQATAVPHAVRAAAYAPRCTRHAAHCAPSDAPSLVPQTRSVWLLTLPQRTSTSTHTRAPSSSSTTTTTTSANRCSSSCWPASSGAGLSGAHNGVHAPCSWEHPPQTCGSIQCEGTGARACRRNKLLLLLRLLLCL